MPLVDSSWPICNALRSWLTLGNCTEVWFPALRRHRSCGHEVRLVKSWVGVWYSNKRFSCHYKTRRGKQGPAPTLLITPAHFYHTPSCGRGGESACVIVRIKGNESCHITFLLSEPHFLRWRCCTFCKNLACFDNSLSEAERKQCLLDCLLSASRGTTGQSALPNWIIIGSVERPDSFESWHS